MREITIEKGTIVYYGNAAGYVSGNKAVVDPLFESQEMQDFLNRQKDISEVKWVDGVFDRLSNGQKETYELTLLKNCRIWQLKPESDILMRFISYDQMKKDFGEPNPQDYQVVYDGEVESNSLETIYTKFNTAHPPGYTGHSLSMSDVVELYDGEGSQFHYCDRFGFKQIDFEAPSQTQTMQL
ncbi:TPA_asm: hypothetical protein GYO74_14015 [Listeria monocytogenes]|jgi:hypothetical protein|uniref:YodL domain-containing protein n=1 Tax=Bacilli TaxID=91061 RepID=UPI0001C2F380|nr:MULTISPECIES: YodL domain-containing protein [Bacilli]ADB68644.1 hypothetical protein LM5578_1896 [Listeria monocytogenes 08-5578]ADB71689.1 hypothetical protein LM5923_1848 [Listeria monocytogenes 08-5923]AHF32560.1 hypothetical protein A430_1906 [Listeria monocytogenes serotype 1/2a str. 08-6569]AHF35551.1 hypothetical protein A431_1906 [Listeria monocytogenes serotype 1/2a str. 08-6997]AHF38542.1 hypothetical protein A435_1906 [Listeria monocytogenes serotype 1/2a str. 10-0815]